MTDFQQQKQERMSGHSVESNGTSQQMINGCVFRGHGHGDWTDYPTHTVPVITNCLEALCGMVES